MRHGIDPVSVSIEDEAYMRHGIDPANVSTEKFMVATATVQAHYHLYLVGEET